MKYQVQLAKILKDRENIEQIESTIGKVVSPPPNLRISIWNGKVILESNQLYMNDRLFSDHTRKFKLDGDIDDINLTLEKNEVTGITTPPVLPFVPAPAPPAPWAVQGTKGAMKGKGEYKANGTIINTDTLKKGDEVKLTPTENSQVWFVDFKVRKLGG